MSDMSEMLREQFQSGQQQLAEPKSAATYDDACSEIMVGFQALCNAMNINIERYEEDQATASCINDGLEDIAAKIVNAQHKAVGSVRRLVDRDYQFVKFNTRLPVGTKLYAHSAPTAPQAFLNNLKTIFQTLNSQNHSPHGDAPGHWHDIAGTWDSDNGGQAGKPCEWCQLWTDTEAMLAIAQES